MAANKPKLCKKCKAPLTDTDRGGVCIPCRLAGLQKRQARLRALKKVAGDAWPRLKKVSGVALPKLKTYLKKENEKTCQSEK